jgi:predicted nuclease of restriction endonuclease-like (RecB) superfamily
VSGDLLAHPADYADWLADLKAQIRGARQRAVLSANQEQVALYHRIGTEILQRQERQGWGAKVIDRLSVDLREAFPDMKGLSSSNLKYMRYFAQLCPEMRIGQQSADQLPWFHIVTLLTKVSDPAAREWYAAQAVDNAWPRATLEAHLKNRLHARQGAAITNFGQRLVAPHAALAAEILKDPYHSISWAWATRRTSATSRTLSFATSPASCWNWAPASLFSAGNSVLKCKATSSSSTCFFITRASSATWWSS